MLIHINYFQISSNYNQGHRHALMIFEGARVCVCVCVCVWGGGGGHACHVTHSSHDSTV